MSDFALAYDFDTLVSDLVIDENDLASDAGLETAVQLSLFCDRRAELGDVLPLGETDRRGWWADALADVPDDKFGSRLWLLDRAKPTAEALVRAEEYAREALQWLLDDKVAEAISVTVTYPSRGVRSLLVHVQRPTMDSVEFRFNHTWASQEAQRP